jgi:predicted RNase H-like nuclease
MFVVGVDGCRSGWVAVALENGAFAGAAQFATFADIARACHSAAVIGVDMPVGLVEHGERICDRLVREFVGARRTSVFVTPPRAALALPSYEEANAECRRRTAFGISRQTWALRDKIFEVDEVVRTDRFSLTPASSDPPSSTPQQASQSPQHRGQYLQHGRGSSRDPAALRRFARIIVPDKKQPPRTALPGGRVIEVHPEASFRELAGVPLDSSKKSYNGMMMRMELLARGGIRIPQQLEIGSVDVDDVLDAAAAAWTANRYAERRARSFPDADAWQHDGDRVVAIWV